MRKHLIIPDVQLKHGDDLTFLHCIGRYILDQRPDVIIQIGDFGDFESLGIFDRGKLAFEGRRYRKDVDIVRDGLAALFGPLREHNRKAKKNNHKRYYPEIHVTLGNHEDRVNRAIQENAVLDGTISVSDCGWDDYGIHVHPFKEVVEIDGVAYAHYFTNTKTGKMLGGSVEYKLKGVSQSFTMGHLPGRQWAEISTPTGRILQGLIVGSCYEHFEDYQGPQGNTYWRGVVVKHEVHEGNYDPMFVSLNYLKRRYG